MARVRKKRAEDIIGKCADIASKLLHYPTTLMQYDYDEAADVVYAGIRKPQKATKDIAWGDGLLIRKEGKQIVGVTIMIASSR